MTTSANISSSPSPTPSTPPPQDTVAPSSAAPVSSPGTQSELTSPESAARFSSEQQTAGKVDTSNSSEKAPKITPNSIEPSHASVALRPQHNLNAKGSFSGASQSLTTVSEDWQNLTSGVREKASAVFSSFGIKAKSSANSLRSRTPQPTHSKTLSTSTSASSRGRQTEKPSSQSSGGAQSPASSISQDESPTKSEVDIPEVTLERPSPDVRQSSDTRRILRRNQSPAASSQPGSMIPPHNKMHQTSSRLLRMTDEERPFTRDFKDLFSTLMVSLPLSSHRVRFQKIDHTFTSEEAINNLGSLKFSQSNRMPDPKDPSRIVTTTTTTTFSMAKEMARSVCQRFMDARFIESADGKSIGVFPLKGALWQMTPKGMHVLQRFCQRNGINQRHVLDVLDSHRNTMQLVILERDAASDKLSHDRATIDVLFRRFAGQDGPNVKASTSTADSDSVTDYHNGLVGVKMARERDIGSGRKIQNSFTGKAAIDWLMDCCTTVDRRETYEIAEDFVKNGLVQNVLEDKNFARQNMAGMQFHPTKDAIYALTEKGQRVAGWIKRTSSPATEAREPNPRSNSNNTPNRSGPRDSNNNRLMIIVNDAALRLLFREYLRDTHCEENLSFFLEVREFTKTYDISERAKAFTRLDAIRENLAAAYGTFRNFVVQQRCLLTAPGLYNAFLAPGSPCELNIDHNLRNSLAGRMTRAVGDDESMLKSLQDVVALFKEAQTSVFKLMSSVSTESAANFNLVTDISQGLCS